MSKNQDALLKKQIWSNKFNLKIWFKRKIDQAIINLLQKVVKKKIKTKYKNG